MKPATIVIQKTINSILKLKMNGDSFQKKMRLTIFIFHKIRIHLEGIIENTTKY